MTPTEAWLSLMSGYVVAYRNSDINFKAFAQHMENLLPNAKEVFLAAGAKGQTSKLHFAAINLISTGKVQRNGMPSLSYARALDAIRNDLKGTPLRRDKLKKVLYSPEFSSEQQGLANLAIRLLKPDPETIDKNFENLDKKLSLLPDRFLKSASVKEVVNMQPQHMDELRYIVKKTVNRNDIQLSPTESAALKEQNLDRHKRYLALRKAVNDVWKNFIRNLVRDEGHHVKVSDAAKALQAAGIEHHWLDGLIKARLGTLRLNEDCKLYDEQNRLLNSAIPQPGSKIVLNPAYTPQSDTYMFKFTIPGAIGTGTPVYRADSVNAGKDEGTDKILKAIPVVPTKRPIWIKDLNGSNVNNRTLATMVELVHELTPRIGSPGNGYIDKVTKKKIPTYGLSTLLVKQITINGNVLILKYRGKAGVLQKHVLKATSPEHIKAIANIKKLLMGKQPNDEVWTDASGKRITGTMVNQYMRSRLGLDISIHEFRDVKGTSLMQEKLQNAKIPKKATQPQVEAIVKKLALDVGKLLGHKKGGSRGEKGGDWTGSTAIKSYIAPKLIADFFKDRGLRAPSWVPTGGRGD